LIKALDVALLVTFFGSYNSSVKGRTRIQKDICILKHRDGVPFNFEFESHYYGPYSNELADTIDTLVASGILEQNVMILPSGVRRYDYNLTEEGNEMFRKTKIALNKKFPRLSDNLKKQAKELRKLSLPDVISLAKKCSGMQSTI